MKHTRHNKKNNDSGHIVGGGGRLTGRPLPPINSQLIGYVIYRDDKQEFYHSHRSGDGFSLVGWCLNPANAYTFKTEQAAYRQSIYIDDQTDILPLYDLGDRYAVGFSE